MPSTQPLRRAWPIVVLLSSASLVGCSSEAESDPLAIDVIDEAIAAVDDHFGLQAEFYEINATSDGVNLFVSTIGTDSNSAVVQARFTSSEGLVVADEAVPSDGPVFRGTAVDFDPSSIIDTAIAELSTAQPRVFIITAASDSTNEPDGGRVSYRLIMESQRGGRLVVFLDARGTILGSDVID